MKTPATLPLLLTAAALSITPAFADLLIYEPFDYTADQPIIGQVNIYLPGSPTWNRAGTAGTNGVHYIISGSLTSPSGLWTSIGNAADTVNADIGEFGRLDLPQIYYTDTTLYYSLLFKLPSVAGMTMANGNPNANNAMLIAFNNGTGAQANRPSNWGGELVIRQGSTDGTFNLGIRASSTPAGTNPGHTYWSQDLNTNETYFVIARYVQGPDAASRDDDSNDLWINPDPLSFGAPEGSEPAPDGSSLGAINTANPGQNYAASLIIGAGISDTNTTFAAPNEILMDEIRVGTNWADVTETNIPARITSQPRDTRALIGGQATFSVSTLFANVFQWRHNGSPIASGTQPSLTLSNIQPSDAGTYNVVVGNGTPTLTSSNATLGVYRPNTESTTNFIVIITDDQGWDSLGVVQREMGAAGRFPWFTNGTPNMDRLAAEGVRFRNAFVTLSLCSPSRAAVLTGRYNHFNGVINNSTPFPTSSVTWATQLRAAGYATGMVGKWHMGQQSARPGFDYTASYNGQGDYDASSSAGTFYVNGVPTANTGWEDDVATDYAIDFINAYCTNSFALLLGYKSSHSPHTPPGWADNLYAGCSAQPTPNSFISAVYRTKIFTPTDARVQNYHECLTAVDVDIGRILDRLDQLDLATNTMVILLGDNGYYLGAHGLDDKRTLYEESLRIPILVRYPRLITQPAVRDELVLNIDIAPTILDLAGVAVPAEMQGRSWRPLLGGEAAPNWRQTFLAEYILEPAYSQIPTTVTLRATGAKFTLWPGHPEWSEMFDLTTDPYEVTNLFYVPAQEAMRAALRADFDQQMRETGLGAQLSPLTFNNGVYSLSVTGGMGPRYELQRSVDMQTWTPVTQVKMDSQQATISDTSAGPPRNFYRVQWIGD